MTVETVPSVFTTTSVASDHDDVLLNCTRAELTLFAHAAFRFGQTLTGAGHLISARTYLRLALETSAMCADQTFTEHVWNYYRTNIDPEA